MMDVDLEDPTSFLHHVYLVCTQRECKTKWNNHWTLHKDVWVTYFCWSNRKIQVWQKPHTHTMAWSYDMEGHAQKCVERYCDESANIKVDQLYKFSHPCLDDHQCQPEVCSQIVLKCRYLARIGRPDILWSANKFARSVTRWTQACDKRLAKRISYSSHVWLSWILSCGKHCTALQTGFVSRLRLCWRPWGLKINLRWCLAYFWKSNFRPSQLNM